MPDDRTIVRFNQLSAVLHQHLKYERRGGKNKWISGKTMCYIGKKKHGCPDGELFVDRYAFIDANFYELVIT